ncbi:MAG: ABC transporter ATP-binding protein [Burkholderiaceae bacterium]|nr:ABC transporter ATP-binding protein [Burkholderiaceae bacterium]
MNLALATQISSCLSVSGLTKSFGGLTALRDVSFEVGEHSIFGIIGPNGAGKTTLFSCLSGLLGPNAGSIMFHGVNVAGSSPARVCRQGIARTFQIVRPFHGMTVLENVMVGAFFHHRRHTEARQAAQAVLERLGMAHLSARDASSLGVADLRALEVARCLATEPKLLLLDEMLAGLTRPEIDRMCRKIHDLRDGGMTVMVIEHSVPAISALCDSVLVLNFGEVLAQGPTDQVLRDPAVEAAYLGKVHQ